MNVHKKIIITAIVLCVMTFSGAPVFAGSTGSQTFSIQVSAINEISVSGNPSTLNVSSAIAGNPPTPVSDSATSYSVTTNGTNKKITGAITAGGNMPADTWLSINLTAPAGASSAGEVDLSTVAANLVTGITQVAESGKNITYELGAQPSGGTLGSTSKTVTLTLAD